jgi:hypothetical protein
MGTGLFVNVKRGRTFARAEIEALDEEELRDLLQRASPAQVRAYCVWLVQWIRTNHANRSIPSIEMSRTKKKG